jgi:hypothetical protein
VLKPDIIEFALDEFVRQLKLALGKQAGNVGTIRRRKSELEAELRRYADALGRGGDMPAIIEAMRTRQAELDSVLEMLLTKTDSIEGRPADIRGFVMERILDMRELLSKDVALARIELVKHLQEITMVPRTNGADPHYEATGNWSLVGDAFEPGFGAQPSNWVGCGGWI